MTIKKDFTYVGGILKFEISVEQSADFDAAFALIGKLKAFADSLQASLQDPTTPPEPTKAPVPTPAPVTQPAAPMALAESVPVAPSVPTEAPKPIAVESPKPLATIVPNTPRPPFKPIPATPRPSVEDILTPGRSAYIAPTPAAKAPPIPTPEATVENPLPPVNPVHARRLEREKVMQAQAAPAPIPQAPTPQTEAPDAPTAKPKVARPKAGVISLEVMGDNPIPSSVKKAKPKPEETPEELQAKLQDRHNRAVSMSGPLEEPNPLIPRPKPISEEDLIASWTVELYSPDNITPGELHAPETIPIPEDGSPIDLAPFRAIMAEDSKALPPIIPYVLACKQLGLHPGYAVKSLNPDKRLPMICAVRNREPYPLPPFPKNLTRTLEFREYVRWCQAHGYTDQEAIQAVLESWKDESDVLAKFAANPEREMLIDGTIAYICSRYYAQPNRTKPWAYSFAPESPSSFGAISREGYTLPKGWA